MRELPYPQVGTDASSGDNEKSDSEQVDASGTAEDNDVVLGNDSDAAKEVGRGDAIGYVVTEDGRLLVWGNYVTRYLVENGDPYSGTRVPTQIATGVLTASGYFGTLAYVDTNNDLWIWGDNEEGLIGDGTTTDSAAPVFVMHNIESVKLGSDCVIALDSDGGVWTWGGTGDTTPRLILSGIKDIDFNFGGYAAAIGTDGTLWVWTTGYDDPDQIKAVMQDVVSVSVYMNRVHAVDTNGTLWGWGWNGEGELGNGELTEKNPDPIAVMEDVKQVAAGRYHTLILKTDGSVWGCGNNTLGLYWGSSGEQQYPTPIKLADDAVSIAAENGRSYYIKSDGTLWGWGYQILGDGSDEDQCAPVQIPLDGPSFG